MRTMDAEEKIRTAIMRALCGRLPARLQPLAVDYQQVEDALMVEIEDIGHWGLNDCFTIEPDDEEDD